MATYVLLDLVATGSNITQTKFRDAINGCRKKQDYGYAPVFISARHCVSPLDDASSTNTFENCVNTNLGRDGGSLDGLTVVHEDDLNQYSAGVQGQIRALVQQIEAAGNTVEGF